MCVQANFRALKFFGLRLREKAKEMEREKCFVPLSLVAKHNLFIYRIRLWHKGFPNHEWSFIQELLSRYCLFSWFIAPHFLTTSFTLFSRRLEVISESENGVRDGHTPHLFSSVPSRVRFFLAPMHITCKRLLGRLHLSLFQYPFVEWKDQTCPNQDWRGHQGTLRRFHTEYHTCKIRSK